MDWATVVVSLGGSLIVGVLSIMGIFLNQRFQLQKEERNKIKNDFNERPQLNILALSPKISFYLEAKSDIEIFLPFEDFTNDNYFNDALAKSKQWECVEYSLKNEGLTEIVELYISTQNRFDIFNLNSSHPQSDWRKSGRTSAVKIHRIIKPQETITLKICFWSADSPEMQRIKKECINWDSKSDMTLNLWIVDFNGKWWKQVLYAPEAQIESASISSERNYQLSFMRLCVGETLTKRKEKRYLKQYWNK